MHVSIDTSEIDTLAAWLRGADPKVNRAAPAVVKKGANNVKDAWNEQASKSRHFNITASYDVEVSGDVVEAEIGPNRHFRSNRLAGIYHFGGANGGGGTGGDPVRVLEAAAPNFEQAIADLIDEALP